MNETKCGTNSYGGYDQLRITALINEMKAHGYGVQGNNPWAIDTRQHGVVLQGGWNSASSILSVSVSAKAWYVPCSKIWESVDPLLRHIEQISQKDFGTVLANVQITPGLCGVHTYGGYNQAKITAVMNSLRAHGYVIQGNNPWTIDTRQHGVILQGEWNSDSSILTVSVIAKAWYVPCSKIWESVDPLLRHIEQISQEDFGMVLANVQIAPGLCGVHTYCGYNQVKITAVMNSLRAHGYVIQGNNPWTIDTQQHGVVLQGEWNSASSILTVSIIAKAWYAPCSKIWESVDPLLRHIEQISQEDFVSIMTLLSAETKS